MRGSGLTAHDPVNLRGLALSFAQCPIAQWNSADLIRLLRGVPDSSRWSQSRALYDA
jgi:hypothetical protein